jgi:hypothetical protein
MTLDKYQSLKSPNLHQVAPLRRLTFPKLKALLTPPEAIVLQVMLIFSLFWQYCDMNSEPASYGPVPNSL